MGRFLFLKHREGERVGMSDHAIEIRLEDLEVKLQRLRVHVQEQDRVIYDYLKKMELLEQQIRQMKAGTGTQAEAPQDEKPPHY